MCSLPILTTHTRLPPPQGGPPPPPPRSHRLDVVQQRDRATGDVYLILNGSSKFLEGYLIKTVALKSLALEEALPALDELQKFNAASQVRLGVRVFCLLMVACSG